MDYNNTKKSSFLSFAFVASIGVIVGLLCAPKTGGEIRDDIRDKLNDIAKKFKERNMAVPKMAVRKKR